MNPYAHCTYHVFAFVQKTPGSLVLTEECQACHKPTGRMKRNYFGKILWTKKRSTALPEKKDRS